MYLAIGFRERPASNFSHALGTSLAIRQAAMSSLLPHFQIAAAHSWGEASAAGRECLRMATPALQEARLWGNNCFVFPGNGGMPRGGWFFF